MQKTFNCLDFLKIFLLLAVIMTHACFSAPWAFWRLADLPAYNLLHSCSEFSCNAVEGFFIISGFLLVMTYKDISLKTFVLKKYFRLSPPAIFSILVCFVLHAFHLVKLRIFGDILTAFMLNNFGICWAKGSNQILWYPSALFAGLILYYSIIKFLPKKKEVITIILVSVSYILLEVLKHGTYSAPYKNFYGVLNIGFLRALGGIGFGCIIAWLQKADIKTNYIFNSISEIILLCGTVYWLFCPHAKMTNFLFVIIFVGLLQFFINDKGLLSNIINKFNYKFLSKYVYSIYVMHYLVGYALCGGFYKNHIAMLNCAPLVYFVLYIILSCFVGVVVYKLVEEPAYKYAKDKLFSNGKS